jgi:hypothetical protein
MRGDLQRDDVLEGRINPGLVLGYETDLDGTPEAYTAMDERRAIKSAPSLTPSASAAFGRDIPDA